MTMIWKYLYEAYRGRILWGKYKKIYGDGNNEHYLFFPEVNSEYNDAAISFFDAYVEKYTIRKLIVLSCDQSVYDYFKNYKHINVINKKITTKQMRFLMRYAAMVDRMKEWTIVSVRLPYNTGAEKLLGMNGIEIKDIVYYDILKLDKKIDEYEHNRDYK